MTSSALFRHLAALIFIAAATEVSSAQDAPPTPPPAPATDEAKTPRPAAPPTSVEFADEPLVVESAGLTMKLPLDTVVENQSATDRLTFDLTSRDSTWHMRVQTPETTNPQATIHDAIETTLSLLQGSVGVLDTDQKQVLETKAVILEQIDNLQINGSAAERLYVAIPTAKKDVRMVHGYTIFKPSPLRYVVMELSCLEPEFARVRPIYEIVVATARFEDPTAVMSQRAAAVAAGVAFLNSLTSQDYDAMFDGQEQWFRLYKPAPSGAPADDAEVGYRSISFWRGQRGEIDPAKSARDFTPTESQEGLLCRIKVRVLDDVRILDTVGIFFMTPDRSQETWSVKTTIRDPNSKKTATWSELGAREGTDLSVVVNSPSQAPTSNRPMIRGEGYLSQVDAYALPFLLMASAVKSGVEGEYAFYVYQSASETVSLRRDAAARDASHAGAWTLKTRFRDELDPQTAVFSEHARLTRTVLPDGLVWEPTTPDDLMRLWSAKSLPTEPLSGRREERRRRRP